MPTISPPIIVSASPGHQSLDRACTYQPQHKFRLVNGRQKIALVKAARFVVDERDSAADHGHDENRHGGRARQQILRILDVWVDFNGIELHLRTEARLHSGMFTASTIC